MKNTWIRYAATAAIAGGMLLAAQDASTDAGTQQAPPPAAAQRHAHRSQRIARYLNLTPAQAAQAKAQLQGARQAAQPERQQLQQARAAMFQAVRANDTAGIDRLSAQEANLKGQISATRNQALARIYSSLSPEQRAKADQLPAHFRQMRQHRMENRQNPSNG
jgi:Spy/CpxP family protein refolding chaperone